MSDVGELLSDLHAHLEATEELPIDPRANRWLGEAAAVAADLATAEGLDDDTIRERVGHVRRLLESAGDTGDEAANRSVEAALDVAERVLETLDE